tara:strand:- start:491 stop:1225 length:735 start_codon:yes stop_codon:yes gene_type:complete
MTTARVIMKTALKQIGVGGQGEDIEAEEMADTLIMFKSLVSSLSIERLYIPHILHASFNLTGASSFAVGSGQTVNIARPIDIESVQYSDGAEIIDLDKIGARDWEQETIESGIPTKFFYNDLYPIAQLAFDKTVTTATGGGGFDDAYTEHFRIGYHAYLTAPVLDTDIVFPEEYDLSLISSLALLCIPMFEADVTDRSASILAANARGLKTIIKNNNSEPEEAELDGITQGLSSRRRYDINRAF